MKSFLILAYILLVSNLFGQHSKELITQKSYGPSGTYSGELFQIVYTKDVLELALSHGLDSALGVVNRVPIYYLDRLTSRELFLLALNEIPTDRIEYHLVDYSLSISNDEMPRLVNDFFLKRLKYLKSSTSRTIPILSNEAFHTIIKNRNDKTGFVLIGYYELLQKLKHAYRKHNAMHSFHMKSNQILLALQQMNSSFITKSKLRKHRKHIHKKLVNYLPECKGEFSGYRNIKIIEELESKNKLNSFSELDITSKSILNELVAPFKKEFSWIYFMFNDNVGFLDLGYRPAYGEGKGKIYRLELINNKVVVHLLSDWKFVLLE